MNFHSFFTLKYHQVNGSNLNIGNLKAYLNLLVL